MLTAYYTTYFTDLMNGPGYILTGIVLAAGAAGLYWNKEKNISHAIARLVTDTLVLWAAGFVFDTLYYGLLHTDLLMDDLKLVVMLVVGGFLHKEWSRTTLILRGSVFFGCMQLALPLSEPFGDLIKALNADYAKVGMGTTPLIMAVLCFLTVIYLQHFSTEEFTDLPSALTVAMVIVSVMAWLIWRVCRFFDLGRGATFTLAALYWVQLWLFYYVFYVAGSQTQKNLELQAMQQKTQLDGELLDLTKQTYDDLHKTRHELKNHLIYLKVLAYKGEWDKLWNYLNTLGSQAEEMFTYVECGNEVVNAVLNHAVGKAKQQGLRFETNLIVPPSLPYDEVDLCSLLSNLANNAIEAATQVVTAQPENTVQSQNAPQPQNTQNAAAAAPTILFSIYPQQDYLFIKVQNPFAPSVSKERRLSLKTTKADARYHGYGTKVIRQIAQKNNGSASFTIEGDQFIATVMLDLGTQRQETAAVGEAAGNAGDVVSAKS